MVSDKSKANLRRGNPRNKGNKNGRTAAAESWADLIKQYGETPAPAEFAAHVGKDATWRQVVVAAAYRHAASGNSAILRELMQRSEPQNLLNIDVDLSKLNTNQLERLSRGEDIIAVLAAG